MGTSLRPRQPFDVDAFLDARAASRWRPWRWREFVKAWHSWLWRRLSAGQPVIASGLIWLDDGAGRIAARIDLDGFILFDADGRPRVHLRAADAVRGELASIAIMDEALTCRAVIAVEADPAKDPIIRLYDAQGRTVFDAGGPAGPSGPLPGPTTN